MRVLVAAWLGSTNLGDELLFRSLSRRLDAMGVQVVALSTDPSETERLHGVTAVHHRDVRAVRAHAREAAAVVFGGGDLLQDVTSPWSLPLHLARLRLARAGNTPVVGVGLGAPPLVRRGSATLIRRAWPRGAPLVTRDAESSAVLRAAGLEPRTGADLVFGLPGPSDIEAEDVAAVSLRPWHGGSTLRPASRGWQAGLDEPMIAATAAGLQDLATRTGLGLRLVAMQRDRDDVLHRAVADRLDGVDVEVCAPDLDGLDDAMGRSRLVVSTRYHGAVLGLRAHRPVIGITYIAKVSSLALQADGAMRTVAHDPDAVRELGARAVELLDAAPDVRAAVEQIRQAEHANTDALASVLDTAP